MKRPDITVDYERDIRIDETALDVEWLNQAPLAIRYARLSAYWNDQVRRLEERVKTIRSELILKVNENPGDLIGKEKPNAGDIEAYYRAHHEYQAAVTELNDAAAEAEFATMVKDEVCYTRKKALENLVQLHGQQYFAGPTVPRNLTAEARTFERQRNSNAKVGPIRMSRGGAPATAEEA